MVEDKAGIKDLNLINQTRDNINISHFYPEELSKYRETNGYLWYCILVCETQCVLNEIDGNC